jgi:hypothetical protein
MGQPAAAGFVFALPEKNGFYRTVQARLPDPIQEPSVGSHQVGGVSGVSVIEELDGRTTYRPVDDAYRYAILLNDPAGYLGGPDTGYLPSRRRTHRPERISGVARVEGRVDPHRADILTLKRIVGWAAKARRVRLPIHHVSIARYKLLPVGHKYRVAARVQVHPHPKLGQLSRYRG